MEPKSPCGPHLAMSPTANKTVRSEGSFSRHRLPRCGHPDMPQTACAAAVRADPPQNARSSTLASIQECLARLGHQAEVVEVVPFVPEVASVNQSEYVRASSTASSDCCSTWRGLAHAEAASLVGAPASSSPMIRKTSVRATSTTRSSH
jgi:hypothetical protein